MALIVADRIKETTTTSGTGDITLGGAAHGHATFSSVMSNLDNTYYTIVDQNTGEYEVGRGTWNTGNTLTRNEVFASSNAGALVNFSGNTKFIFITYPADKSAHLDLNGDLDLLNDLKVAGTFVFDSVNVSAIQTSLEAFSDNDTSLMTSAAINDLIGTGIGAASIDDLADVVITTPADASFLIYDSGTLTWRDAVFSGDVTVSDTGVATVTDNSHNHTLSNVSDVTATAAEVNLLDLAGRTAGDVLVADTATTASWQQLVLGDVSDVTATAAEVNLLDLSGLTAGWALLADTATTASWQAITLSDISDAATAITLDYVTTNGNTTTNAITVGAFTSTGIDDNAASETIQIGSNNSVQIWGSGSVPTAPLGTAYHTILVGDRAQDANAGITLVSSTAAGAGWGLYHTTADLFQLFNWGDSIPALNVSRTTGFDFQANDITTTGVLSAEQAIIGGSYANADGELQVYENTTLGGTEGNSTDIATFAGNSTNITMKQDWLYRFTAGTSWTTTAWLDGITVDTSFSVKGPIGSRTVKTWHERRPNTGYLAWGDTSNVYLELTSTLADFQGLNIDTTGDVSGGTIGGITEANLLDKTASETVSGAWGLTGSLSIPTTPGGSIVLANEDNYWRWRMGGTSDPAGIRLDAYDTPVFTADRNGDITNIGNHIITGDIYSPAATDSLRIGGGSSGSNGGNVVFYGASHASQADDIEFLANSTTVLQWDDSGGGSHGVWDFGGYLIKANGNGNANYNTAAEIVELGLGSFIGGGADSGAVGSMTLPANLWFSSWYGISFNTTYNAGSVAQGECSHKFNTRNGDAEFAGNLYVDTGTIGTEFYLTGIAADRPAVVFDTGDYFEYNQTTDYFRWVIGSTERMRLSSGGALNVKDTLTIDDNGLTTDSLFTLSAVDSVTPALTFDVTDYFSYNRTNNEYRWLIGNTEYLALNSTGLDLTGTFTASGLITADGGVTLGTSDVINMSATSTKDKYRVWNSSSYAIGMATGFNFGYLGSDTINSGTTDYAMTFQMNVSSTRGFHWGTTSHTSNTGAMSLTTGGKLYVNDIIFANGGITFATTGETLDSYEEGTWTPRFCDFSGVHHAGLTDGTSYKNQSGWYTRIGRMVFAQFKVGVSALGSEAATALTFISGLPFTAATDANGGNTPTGSVYYNSDTATGSDSNFIASNADWGYFRSVNHDIIQPHLLCSPRGNTTILQMSFPVGQDSSTSDGIGYGPFYWGYVGTDSNFSGSIIYYV